MHFTSLQKEQVIQNIKNAGFNVTGWCRVNGLNRELFYDVLKNRRGNGVRPSPKCDQVLDVLRSAGYLTGPAFEENVREEAA